MKAAGAVDRTSWLRKKSPECRSGQNAPVAGRPTKLTDELADDRASRIDVDEGTRTNDRVNTERIFEHDPTLAILQLDALDTERWAQAFADLAKRYKRGTLKESREAFSMLYDHFAIDPNPVLLRSWRPLEFAESSCSSPGTARSSTCVARCRSATASGAAGTSIRGRLFPIGPRRLTTAQDSGPMEGTSPRTTSGWRICSATDVTTAGA